MTYQSLDLNNKKYQDNSAKLIQLIQSFPLVNAKNEHLLLKKMKEKIGFAKIKYPMNQNDIKKIEMIVLPAFNKDGYPGKHDLVSAKITYTDGSKQLHLLNFAPQDQLELINTLLIALKEKAEKSFLSIRILAEEYNVDWKHLGLNDVYTEKRSG
ncbi:hypothetical protein LEAN103870_14095 [Legionella anisa]|uniref:Uncharacterized protein n=1 Tax=Legionella anisa TaxID=28082 RepID=A0AAX0WTR7_9GAMM|nr:hypothetical protein [Legionella anisa]AWN74674.1 hypothetical protein DLD14_12975 [Legionella anisa]KTC77468.1 hypothetical protein Lani_0026 [Legionella anisa]MBN5935916.1 hypothetical protein [Legionella anisa]MCW8425209.1 hypothetical protein [Legionella anisa]MCW8449372.1 hypothetical protein [Legionella anisa]